MILWHHVTTLSWWYLVVRGYVRIQSDTLTGLMIFFSLLPTITCSMLVCLLHAHGYSCTLDKTGSRSPVLLESLVVEHHRGSGKISCRRATGSWKYIWANVGFSPFRPRRERCAAPGELAHAGLNSEIQANVMSAKNEKVTAPLNTGETKKMKNEFFLRTYAGSAGITSHVGWVRICSWTELVTAPHMR